MRIEKDIILPSAPQEAFQGTTLGDTTDRVSARDGANSVLEQLQNAFMSSQATETTSPDPGRRAFLPRPAPSNPTEDRATPSQHLTLYQPSLIWHGIDALFSHDSLLWPCPGLAPGNT